LVQPLTVDILSRPSLVPKWSPALARLEYGFLIYQERVHQRVTQLMHQVLMLGVFLVPAVSLLCCSGRAFNVASVKYASVETALVLQQQPALRGATTCSERHLSQDGEAHSAGAVQYVRVLSWERLQHAHLLQTSNLTKVTMSYCWETPTSLRSMAPASQTRTSVRKPYQIPALMQE